MNNLLKVALLTSIAFLPLYAMEKEEKIEEDVFPQIMRSEKDIKALISHVPLPSSLKDIKLEDLGKLESYKKAQEIIKTITFSETGNKVKLRDFLRENILDTSNPFEIFLNEVASSLKKISVQEVKEDSSHVKGTHFTQQFFENKEAVRLYQNALLQICLGDSEGYLNFGVAIGKLRFQELEDQKLQAKILQPFIQKYLEKTEEKYKHLHRGLQIPPAVELSVFDVLFFSLEQEEQVGKLDFYKNLYKEKFTGFIDYLLKPETFDLFKEKVVPDRSRGYSDGFFQGVNIMVCSHEVPFFKHNLHEAWRSLYLAETGVMDEYAVPAAYLKYISSVVSNYGEGILQGKFYFGNRRKIEQLFADVQYLCQELKSYGEKSNVLKTHIENGFSLETKEFFKRQTLYLGATFCEYSINGLVQTLKGIELYESSEDKETLLWQLTEFTNFWWEWKQVDQN